VTTTLPRRGSSRVADRADRDRRGIGADTALAEAERDAVPSSAAIAAATSSAPCSSLITSAESTIGRGLEASSYFVLVRLIGVLTGHARVSLLQLENAVLRHQETAAFDQIES
jgi:hypothetical protein